MYWIDRVRRYVPCFVVPVAPEYPPKALTLWDILISVILTALGYFGTIVITGKALISWDLKALAVSVCAMAFSIIIVEIRSAKRLMSSALTYSLVDANNALNEQRRLALQAVLKYSPSPCKVLRKYLDTRCYNEFNTSTIEEEMQQTHTMYTVNSYDIIPKQQLDEESVCHYLSTQKNLVKEGKLSVERLFRLKVSSIQNFLDLHSKAALKELVDTIVQHCEFKAEVHLYTEKNTVNTFLDYAIAQQKARMIVFITDTDELSRHNRYVGIRTSDPLLIEILLKDRFDPDPLAVEKRYKLDEFIKSANQLLER